MQADSPKRVIKRTAQLPKGKAIYNGKRKPMTDETAGKSFPLIQKVDEATGEVTLMYQYKARFRYKPEFAKDPEKPVYNYPDYLIIKEYARKHPNTKVVRFSEKLREFILTREFKSQEIIVYDNTGEIEGDIIYQSVWDAVAMQMNIQVNYIFPARKNYIIHPRSK
jgi:hypothetical protein